LYLACVLFRLVVVCIGAAERTAAVTISPTEIEQLNNGALTTYTVLVPLYREANIIESVLESLARLDYPAHLLDVKLLLEADDIETIEAVQSSPLPGYCETVIVPVSFPRTKPKACNHGLAAARGEYVVIFDAEDRPDADQLKKAILAFRRAPDDVACFQAKLNYYNADQNQLTRWFTIEYTMWFEFFLPGLRAIGAAIPLGGTSNHFRADLLRKLGGWDPFNVTEDCDLGIRIYRSGYRTLLLDSTTWEEATSRLGSWVKQRSRWIKGFLQTHLAHTRNPVALARSLGAWRSICFLLTVGWTAATLMINLVFWIIGLVYAALLAADAAEGRSPIEMMAGDRDSYRLAWKLLYYGAGEDPLWSAVSIACFCATVALLLANVIFIGVNCLACTKPPARGFLWSALSCPVYWVLISLAAARGAVELFTKPFHWSKTAHGLWADRATGQTKPSLIPKRSPPGSEPGRRT
ncbi:MAG: glycosyltransferase family 2 protein, partial [Candidatus Saccharimonadales bacterium]